MGRREIGGTQWSCVTCLLARRLSLAPNHAQPRAGDSGVPAKLHETLVYPLPSLERGVPFPPPCAKAPRTAVCAVRRLCCFQGLPALFRARPVLNPLRLMIMLSL